MLQLCVASPIYAATSLVSLSTMKLSVSCLVGMSAAVYGLDAPFQTYPDCTDGPLAENKVCDRSLPPAERAAALVDALTNEEKLANLVRYVMPGDKWGDENF